MGLTRHKGAPTAHFLTFLNHRRNISLIHLDAKANYTVLPPLLDPRFVNVFQSWFQAGLNLH